MIRNCIINVNEIVTQRVLHEKLKEKSVIRIGATRDPITRAKQYEAANYTGDMYYAETENMELAENRLLELAFINKAAKHNIQTTSNVQPTAGYVYIIQGRKYNN